jgi:RNA polymerase sigma-70 factor, ECF subfamily
MERDRLAADHDAWEGTCRGDAGAFDALYRAHSPKLELFLRRVLRNHQAAEDVMQETFAGIWQRPNGFDPDRGTLRAYLFGVARKRAAEWWRKNGASTESISKEPTGQDSGIGPLIAEALSQLSVEGQALIWLREVEGYSYDELAQVFEVPAGTVASRLFAVRDELRRIWHTPPLAKKEDS